MAKLLVKKATTDVTVYLFIRNSSLTTGAGLTGLAYNTANLACYYVRPLAAAAQLALATQTVDGAHGDGGFVEVDATNMPGIYRLDLSDAICATGVNSVVVMLKGATDMEPVALEIQLTNFDLNTAAPDVNVLQISGDATAADNAESFFDGTGYAGTNNVIPTVTDVTNGVSLANGAITAAVVATDAIDADAIAANAVTEIQSGLSTFNSASDGVIVTTNNDKTGYALSAAGVDAILDEAITEPVGVFAWGTATLRNIVGWLGALNRNKITQTANTQTLRNDADNASLATSTVSDDATTATRGEWT